MKFGEFLKDKMSYIISCIFIILSIEILLILFKVHVFVMIYVASIPIILFLICFLVEYYKKKSYYNTLIQRANELEEKYLITEIIKNPDFVEGKILNEILQETGKSMLENVNKYKYLRRRI